MAFIGLDAEEYDRKYRDTELLKRIVNFFGPYKREMTIVILFLTASSLANALVPVLISLAINNIESNLNLLYLAFVIMLILTLNLLSFIFNYIRQINSSKAIGSVVLDLREKVSKSVLNHDLSFFDKNPIGKIVSRMNSDSQDFARTVELSVELISSLFIVMILLIFMSIINFILTIIFLLSLPLFFVVAISYRKLAREKTLLGQRALASVNSYVKESFSGIHIAKTFRKEDKLYKKFKEVNDQSYKVNLKRAFVLNAIFPSLGIVQGIVLTLIIYFGGSFILGGVLTAGELFLFLQSLWLLFFPIIIIAAFWPQFQAGLAASERIFALIDTTPKVIQNNNIKPDRLKGEIEFRNLVFRYDEDNNVFEEFSLKIKPGESLAIVGHTGAGKSSLAKLLARFYEFQGGEILIDGISIRDFDLTEYRKQIGIIPQTPFLWADTVENNVKYCCNYVPREKVIEAFEKAGGFEWVSELSGGLETNIRERGSLLSMGQRQLLVFARTILENPSILILDEATASVDPFTETKIQEALEETMKNRTSIVIAHRLWTVRHVDRIIVLDHGKIIEEGNHETLMTKGGNYANLYNTYFRHQSLEYIEKFEKFQNNKN
ncbi:MAG: ATP-binding cassette domain-containing protein [Candidatus Lokiarchaeota archaeon]|nr:ATP-binding cassette domain-containing protein [Candidatus Lokiarchaeota archaeon]MBD3338947.1 ATP-binding cassette domain-containing protein [Candidatus Lokiarchaeota archaeon]